MTAWVLMAYDGPRWYGESAWEPIAVFGHKPSVMETGRALVYAYRRGALPWGHYRGMDREDDRWCRDWKDGKQRLLRITDLTDVREVPS